MQQLKKPDALLLRDQTIEAITTNETSFNRDGHPFEQLRRSILPELASRLIERRAATRLSQTKGADLVGGRIDRSGSLQRGDGRGRFPGRSIDPGLTWMIFQSWPRTSPALRLAHGPRGTIFLRRNSTGD